VIVPGENDGEELAYTARELFKYYPAVQDVACVPTGLTKYRAGLYQIGDIDKEYSEKLLDQVDALNQEFGVNFLLPADEYFVKAEREMKPTEFYGDFAQIENGIGLTTKFLAEANTALADLLTGKEKVSLEKKKHSVIICGVSAAKTLAKLIETCNRAIDGLTVELLPVENDFFGRTVTCTGLLTGRDTVRALQTYFDGGGQADEIILSSQMFKEFEDVFLCGMTLKQMKKALHFKNIRVNRDGGAGLIALLANAERR
jgi:NifB/MoaA-like Fe-S oxidoreductase